jgi:hypothetical protein
MRCQNRQLKKGKGAILVFYFLKITKFLTRCSQKGDSVSFSLTPNLSVQIGEVCGPFICTQAAKNIKMAAKGGRKQ